MNINDFEAPQDRPANLLQAMMDNQAKLMGKYHDIEKRSGLLQTELVPVDIDSKGGQARLKDFSWRITEELMEAIEAYEMNDIPHFHEELIDAVHFMLEQHLLLGYDSNSCCDAFPFSSAYENPLKEMTPRSNGYTNRNNVVILMFEVIKELGLAMNCLKNKPWKQTNMLTDKAKFHVHISTSCKRMFILLGVIGLTPENIYDLYFRKAQVNNFRQDSKY